MIKIAYLIDSLGRTGAQKILLDICKFIDKKEFEVFVLFWRKGGFYNEFKKIKGLRLICLKDKPKATNSNFFMKIPTFFKQQKELRKIVKKEEFDMIHSHLFFPDIHNSLLKRKFKDIITLSTKHDTAFYRKKRYLLIGNLFDSNMDYVTTCSNTVGDILKRYNFIKNVQPIQNAVDLKEISSAKKKKHNLINKNNFNIISIGRLTEQKGFNHLIRTFALFNENVKNSRLFICGEGEKRKELERLIKTLNLKGKVHLLGIRGDVYSLMKSCDLFMLLSNWEGFGIVILEAMACKIPVIGSDVDGIKEIIKDGKNGYLVNRFGYGSITSFMVVIKENKIIRNMFVKEGFKKVKNNFEISKTVKEYEKIYINCIKKDVFMKLKNRYEDLESEGDYLKELGQIRYGILLIIYAILFYLMFCWIYIKKKVKSLVNTN